MATENPMEPRLTAIRQERGDVPAQFYDEGFAAGAAAGCARLLDRLTSDFGVTIALDAFEARTCEKGGRNPFDAMGFALDQVRAWIDSKEK